MRSAHMPSVFTEIRRKGGMQERRWRSQRGMEKEAARYFSGEGGYSHFR